MGWRCFAFLKELSEQRRDFQSADPMQRARELRSKADRINSVANHLEQVGSILSDTRIAALRTAADNVRIARELVALLQKTALTPDLLPGTGGNEWRKMWDAAAEFLRVSQPRVDLPVTDGRCPYCQQELDPDAVTRLQHFAEYASSEAQGTLKTAELKFETALFQITGMAIGRNDITMALAEIGGEDALLAEQIKQFQTEALRIQNAVKIGAEDLGSLPATGLSAGPTGELRAAAAALQARAAQLVSAGSAFDPKLAQELTELESRVSLAENLEAVLGEIERKKRLAAYHQCIDDTSTQQITRKSTELTKELVTDQLQRTFQDELTKLEFKHLAIEIQTAGGTKGALFHHLVFPTAPSVSVIDVLSEGECRTLSLAAFLTELSTAPSRSAIIFDDPVSSLDHIWRERIARRLVSEAKNRQVIVFTHDLLFLRLLLDESEKQGINCDNQYVRRDGQAGICSPDLPWIAMPVKERIGKLRVRWQAADKTSRIVGPEAFEREAHDIYGYLREAWEQGVSEVLLNDVVERYRPSIETQKLRFLHDITEADLTAVEEAMTLCSRWMRGHDHPAADGTPFPDSATLKKRIDDLEAWVKAVRQRRK
ncbi:MAG: AAA family ATPase [Candidatus Sulfotelmatobacter sp.]